MSSAKEGAGPATGWIVNVLTALLVAVVSGLLVWVLTKEPSRLGRSVLKIEKMGEFKSRADGKYFYKITLKNDGVINSKGVTISSSAGDESNISESAITTTSTRPKISKFSVLGSSFDAQIPILKPEETVIFWLGYVGRSEPSIRVVATSDDGPVYEVDGRRLAEKLKDNPIILFFVIVAYAGFGLVAYNRIGKIYRKRRIKKIKERYEYWPKNINNPSFILLHSGNADVATPLFVKAIIEGEGDPITLSNYALSLAVQGDVDSANNLISSALNWTKDSHEINVVTFNKELIQLIVGDRGAIGRINALRVLSDEIEKYASRSILLSNLQVGSQLN